MFQPFDDATLEKMDQSTSVWFKRWGLEHDKFSDERWAIHRANAHVPLQAYRCRILHRFGQIVAKKTLVYLDLKYWINFRKVQLGQAVNPCVRSSIRHLNRASQRWIYCMPPQLLGVCGTFETT